MKEAKLTRFVKRDESDRKWYVIDATDQVLGRLAVKAARIIRGKHKPVFTPNNDTGDFVVVINADKVRMTGKREEKKVYYRHSQYPGGLKTISYKEMKEKKPEFIIHNAVRGMLPKNRLGRQLIKKLKVYAGSEHPHEAQQPQKYSV